MKIKITMNENTPLYQKFETKIRELKALGMSNVEIATKLNISKTTINNILNF